MICNMSFIGCVFAVSLAVLFPLISAYPNVRYNLTESVILRCPQKFQAQLELLEYSLHLHVILRTSSHIQLVTSGNSQITIDWYYTKCNCTFMGHANDSLYKELSIGQHHVNYKRSVTNIKSDWFASYHNLSEIYNWFRDLADDNPHHTEFVSIGVTGGNNQIYAFKISNTNRPTGNGDRPKVYLQCLLHAREWITGPACMYTAYQIVSMIDNTERTSVKKILSLVDIIIIPVANPDGYELTWTDYPKYRLWRKNLSTSSSTSCQGVDLNRNFDVEWGKHGSSTNGCSETFQGVSPMSEKETVAISQFLNHNRPIIGALDIHSYSQAILYPPAWKSTGDGENTRLLQEIAREVAIAATLATNKDTGNGRPDYISQQMGSIYLASGTFTDWINSEQFKQSNVDSKGIRYDPLPLTVELYPKDTGNTMMGFMVPPDEILPTCKEIFEGIRKYISLVVTNHNDKKHIFQ